MTHLNPTALGLAFGLLWGAGVLLLSFTSMQWGYGTEWVELLSTTYLGGGATWAGAITGAVWGFVDGFIGGWLLAWLYNKFS